MYVCMKFSSFRQCTLRDPRLCRLACVHLISWRVYSDKYSFFPSLDYVFYYYYYYCCCTCCSCTQFFSFFAQGLPLRWLWEKSSHTPRVSRVCACVCVGTSDSIVYGQCQQVTFRLDFTDYAELPNYSHVHWFRLEIDGPDHGLIPRIYLMPNEWAYKDNNEVSIAG